MAECDSNSDNQGKYGLNWTYGKHNCPCGSIQCSTRIDLLNKVTHRLTMEWRTSMGPYCKSKLRAAGQISFVSEILYQIYLNCSHYENMDEWYIEYMENKDKLEEDLMSDFDLIMQRREEEDHVFIAPDPRDDDEELNQALDLEQEIINEGGFEGAHHN